ncbi:MAG: hypothetical protein FD167_318 [bacterium]|nr:MAG: hypothetical protein FD167_318 [bacterium]
MHITDNYLRIIKSFSSYCAKKLHTFIGSCITSDKNDTSESFPNTTKQSVPKTTKLSKSEDEDMYLDLDEMEVKSQKPKNTTSLN